MGKYAIGFVILALMVVLALVPAAGNAAEYRALSIDGWYNGMWNSGEIDGMLDLAERGNYNVICPQIRKKADAIYVSHYGGPDGTGEPMVSQVSPPGFDPLLYMCQEAHLRDIKVVAWVGTHSVATLPRPGYTQHDWFYDTHNDWLTKNSSGNLVYEDGWYIDPGVPDGEEYLCNLIMDVVDHYDIDGLQWDRIRLPGSNYGYNTIARNRYLAECAEQNPDPNWNTWRRDQLTDFVSRVYAQIMEKNPNLIIGVTSWADQSSGVGTYFQDVPTWMSGHWLDMDNPMNYSTSNATFNGYLQTHLNTRGGRYVYTMHNIGTSGQTQAGACNQILNARSFEAAAGQPIGVQTYSYRYGVTTSAGWFDYVSAAGRPFQATDTVPGFPWKTDGSCTIFLGRVTDAAHPNDPVYHDWINRATVELWEPGGVAPYKTTLTDQTGYFVFNDVAPRVQTSGYRIVISKNEYTTREFTDQAIAGNEVKRIDVELGTCTVTSPTNTIKNPKAFISLPNVPVTAIPTSIFPDIPLHYNLTRWNRPAQSWVTYNQYSPGLFGNMDIDNGYWLKVSSPYTAQYTGYGTSTATRTQSLPKAGWNLIGCPFTSDHKWADMTITYGGSTVSLQQAKTNQWIISKANWWDSSSQSWKTVGLPLDFPTTQNYSPWHGYYFKTLVDNIQLTQR